MRAIFIIGEKINATRAEVTEIIDEKDSSALATLAMAQVEAGADYVDINVGTGKGNSKEEQENMAWAVEIVQGAVDVPLVVDSADLDVIQAGLDKASSGTAIINSVSGRKESLEPVLALAKKFNTKVIALAMDDNGIPEDVEGRLKVCREIVFVAERFGVSFDRLIFDPLVLPVSVKNEAGKTVLEALGRIKELAPGSGTVMGVSNISYGLPNRSIVNQTFLSLALFEGLDYAIVDPFDKHLMQVARATETILGQDKYCRKYIATIRKQRKEGCGEGE